MIYDESMIAGQYIADTLDTLSKKLKDDRIDVHRLIGINCLLQKLVIRPVNINIWANN